MFDPARRVIEAMEAREASSALNELMGVADRPGKRRAMGMRDCLRAVMRHAGIKGARVYRAREGRMGKRLCYVFGFLSGGRKYYGWVDAVTCEILKFGFYPAGT